MCGFSGFIDNIPNKKNVLESMMDEIIHRGPDESGEYIDDNAALGFRRLSIIGVGNGLQPLYNEDGSLALVFNGEIYNYQELREDLIKKGHIFKTETDSEVLIHLYEDCKNDMVKKLRGMFAFAIWDKNEQTLFAARDHFGIKPFYYTQVEKDGQQSLIFGSEIKSLLMHPNFKKEVNKEALKPYLTFQYSVLDETFFKGVFKLRPGHFMVYKDGELKIEKYWDVEFNQEDISLEESIKRIQDAVSESVEVHSHSEVPLGSFLSGGVDSSYIAKCLMPQKTFSVGFEQENFDESDLAKDLSDILGIENVRKTITADECFEMLPTIQYHMDEPQSNPSSVPLYFLAKLAREHVTVVLSGEGADEIFGGYEWYDDDPKLKKYKKLPAFIRKPVAKVAKKMPYFKGRTTLIRGGSPVEDTFIGQAQIFEEREAVDVLKAPYQKSPSVKDITKPVYDRVKNQDDVTKKQYLDLKLWLAGDILLKADKMSMAHSIELRVPFLDKEVMKVGEVIPTKYKVNDETTKVALRYAAKEVLPEEWAKRQKKGFPVPIRFWFKEQKYYDMVKEAFTSDYASEFFDTEKIVKLLDDHFHDRCNNARKIYTIYVFLVWYKRFFIAS
ncbi:asparagine synthase (glutamine-hydrolyzing) [Intestinibacter bartlettii]|uniref:asparagine synthase (glutamine-hydrolyzing) n=1 Tax=Intestinibacter bartlettii TaxID=261299 RepID=A0ABS6DV36_9FIRM|nr:asparagine synthase (glutamine-hydrolyzing) [Intestinibacter bartlettii]MBU5335117.1 asparagine synthase (glutamine-hydrolyzing) [Intestinibacter bartlettii]MDO5010376.1 asparagine synthase (glutamine-hydrolyzing) [Intestinibacter bartlettii]